MAGSGTAADDDSPRGRVRRQEQPKEDSTLNFPLSNLLNRQGRRLGILSPKWEDRSTLNWSLVELNHFVDRVSKLFKAGRGDNDGVAMIVSTFGNPQERALQILFQIKCELFPLDLKLGVEQLRIHDKHVDFWSILTTPLCLRLPAGD